MIKQNVNKNKDNKISLLTLYEAEVVIAGFANLPLKSR